MNKLTKSLQKNLIENSFRLLSLANITVNKVALPTAQKAYTYLQERVPLQEQQDSYRLVNSLRKNLKGKWDLDQSRVIGPLESLGDYLDQSVREAEIKLREQYGIKTNQWLFTMENIQMIEQIGNLLGMTLGDIRGVSKYNTIRYLNAWTVLQRLYLASSDKNVNTYSGGLDFHKQDLKFHELRQLKKELLYYSSGKLFYYMGREGKKPKKGVEPEDFAEGFVFHSKILETDVLHSFWETKPYKPAYVITRDQLKKGIILSIRGTHDWNDALTDLDFHYVKFSIMKETNSDELFLKFHYTEDYQEYLKDKIGYDTRDLNGKAAEPLTGNEVVIETGYAHAGVLVSAIGAYKEITPKLEEILSKPDHGDYNLTITGHSLGGGVATLLVLLCQTHPLKAMGGLTEQKLRGYNYGGAAVLSWHFDKHLKHSMKSVVYGDDVIPRLGYGSVKDLCNMVLAFDEINAKDPSVLSEVLSVDVDQIDFSNVDIMQSMQMEKFKDLYRKFKHNHMNCLKLPPMGRVFHIHDFKSQPIKRGNHSYEYVLREIEDKEYFDEIIVSKQLAKHHFPPQYEGGLSSDKVLYQRYVNDNINNLQTLQ